LGPGFVERDPFVSGISSAFPTGHASPSDFGVFFAHFGPQYSLFAKYSQFLGLTELRPTLRMGRSNVFELALGRAVTRFYNNPTRNVGEPFLTDDFGRSYENWASIDEIQSFIPHTPKVHCPVDLGV
jgi:hypothetical protein